MCHSTSLREPFSKRFFAKIYLVGSVEWEVGVKENGKWDERQKREKSRKINNWFVHVYPNHLTILAPSSP